MSMSGFRLLVLVTRSFIWFLFVINSYHSKMFKLCHALMIFHSKDRYCMFSVYDNCELIRIVIIILFVWLFFPLVYGTIISLSLIKKLNNLILLKNKGQHLMSIPEA